MRKKKKSNYMFVVTMILLPIYVFISSLFLLSSCDADETKRIQYTSESIANHIEFITTAKPVDEF